MESDMDSEVRLHSLAQAPKKLEWLSNNKYYATSLMHQHIIAFTAVDKVTV